MDNIFEEKGYKLIELNLGYDDIIVEVFEDIEIQPVAHNMVSIPPLHFYMERLAAIAHRDYLTSIVEKEIDLKIIPTFCYTRKYFQGSILSSHTDRDSCEISLSYCISGPEWEINMGDNTLITKKGNGVIYKGCEVEHGRSKPSSGEVIQVFNHWVISDGAKSKSAYDGGITKDFYKNKNY
jgi:hypothetical protein